MAASADPMVAYSAGFVLERKASGRSDPRIPVASADLKDFVSGCWFAHGSTALLRREAFARVGPADPALRRLEDFDWFIRFVSTGGRLEVWPHIAAVIAPTVTLGGAQMSVEYAGLVPGSIGLYQINAVVPRTAPAGLEIPLVVNQGGSSTTLSVRVVKQ